MSSSTISAKPYCKYRIVDVFKEQEITGNKRMSKRGLDYLHKKFERMMRIPSTRSPALGATYMRSWPGDVYFHLHKPNPRPEDVIRRKKPSPVWFPYTTSERLKFKLEELISCQMVAECEEQRSLLEAALLEHFQMLEIDSHDVNQEMSFATS